MLAISFHLTDAYSLLDYLTGFLSTVPVLEATIFMASQASEGFEELITEHFDSITYEPAATTVIIATAVCSSSSEPMLSKWECI